MSEAQSGPIGAGGVPAPSQGEEAEAGALSGELLRVILVASFGSFLLNLSSTTVSVAVDQLMRYFAAPLSSVQWVVTGYLLALALVLPSFRWTLERLGSRRLYVGSLLAFAATSAFCALAWSIQSLMVFRVLQGAVGGLLAPLTQALVAELAGPKRMGRAVSIISIPVLVAPLFGPVVGGLVIQHLSWRWLFLLNAPFAVVGAWVAQRRLPPGVTSKRSRLDFVGLALLSPGIALFVYVVSSVGRARSVSPSLFLALALAVALIIGFVLYARPRPESALIDLRLFKRPMISAALVAYLLTSFGTFGAQLLLPLYYQQVRGQSAIGAGLLLAPQALGMLLTLPQVGKVTDRFDNGKIAIGAILMTLLGTYAFTQVTDESSYALLSLSLIVRGAGLGATGTPVLAAAYKHLTRVEIPNATAAINIVQRLGAPLGTAAMAMVLQRFTIRIAPEGSHALLARAFAHTFLVSAGLSALALFAALALVRQQQILSAQPTKGT